MASSYTSNNRIEKIGTGEQAGTWGSTTNTNFDIIDRAINGVGAITLSGTTHTLTTTDGALSDGHFKVLVFGGSPSNTNTITITPNNQDKLYFVKNNTNQSITIKQGSGTTVTIAATKTAIVYADGAGSGANVAQIETGSDEFTEDVTIKTSDGALLTLQTEDTTITDGDVLGALQFQAPDDTDGNTGDADGSKVTASIVGEADATFNADTNSTDLVFKLATDGDAAEKMRLTHEGDLNLVTDGKSIKFGADSEITLTHVHNSGLTLTNTVSNSDNAPAVLNLKSEEDSIVDGNVIGKITFTAGDSDGVDSIEIAASIEAEADGAFDQATNQTDLVFKLGSSEEATEKMRLAHEGVLSIPADGSTTTNGIHIGAGADLKVYHDGSNTYASNSTGELVILTTTDSAVTLQHNSASKLFTQSTGVTVSGVLTATGNITTSSGTVSGAEVTATSDERLKSDIKTIDNALDKVMNMRGVSFTKQAEKGIGVIAQEVEKVLPEVVHDGEYKSVAYGNMVGVLIEAIKEQQKQIDELKKDK